VIYLELTHQLSVLKGWMMIRTSNLETHQEMGKAISARPDVYRVATAKEKDKGEKKN
jgi:hypothetical protein